ncbi:MAG: hypothetical protein ABIH63_01530 [archaeon]
MKKWWLLVFILVLFIFGCSNSNFITGGAVVELSDVQVAACESAAGADSCDKLVGLGIVSEGECCSGLGLCCVWVPVGEFKEVLIQAIKDYFSGTSVLTVDELKDLIVAYFTASDVVDLSGTGEYSGSRLMDIYSKAKTTPSCTNECSPSGAKQCYNTASYQTCGNYDADSCLDWSTATNCPSSQTCSNGQCVSPTQNCRGTCKESACSSYQSCSSASGSCTTGYCCSGNCTFVSNDTQRHMGCYNGNIYWLGISNKPVELIQECNVDCAGGWPVNSFCYERSDGKVEVRMYPECFETYCKKDESNGEFYCYSPENDFPKGVYNVEYGKANCYTFTINQDYKNNPRYWYIGEPTSPILTEDMVDGRGMPKYTYIDPDHPKIVNRISTSGVYWNEEGVLVRSSNAGLAKPPCRILTDLIPFYEENNISYYPGYVCTNNTCLCKDKCSQSFTDSFYYTNEKFVFAKCN